MASSSLDAVRDDAASPHATPQPRPCLDACSGRRRAPARPSRLRCGPAGAFFPSRGNMAVGNAYTLSSGPGSSPLLLELGMMPEEPGLLVGDNAGATNMPDRGITGLNRHYYTRVYNYIQSCRFGYIKPAWVDGTMNPADQQRRMLEMQHKIRNDAQQQQHYLGEFADWNRDIAKKDKERRAAPADLPPVRGGRRVGVRNSNAKADAGASKHRQQSAKAPGAHVYDKGYKKWEQFDADNYDIDEAATTVVEEDAVTQVPADARLVLLDEVVALVPVVQLTHQRLVVRGAADGAGRRREVLRGDARPLDVARAVAGRLDEIA